MNCNHSKRTSFETRWASGVNCADCGERLETNRDQDEIARAVPKPGRQAGIRLKDDSPWIIASPAENRAAHVRSENTRVDEYFEKDGECDLVRVLFPVWRRAEVIRGMAGERLRGQLASSRRI